MGRDKKKPIAKIYYYPFLDMGRKENSLQNLLTKPISAYGQRKKKNPIAKFTTTHFWIWEGQKAHGKIYYKPICAYGQV
jgi:hypothetical protein